VYPWIFPAFDFDCKSDVDRHIHLMLKRELPEGIKGSRSLLKERQPSY
jgi:hypothetical protein